MKASECQLKDELIDQLEGVKYVSRADICDLASLVQDFRSDQDQIWHGTSGSNVRFASFAGARNDWDLVPRAEHMPRYTLSVVPGTTSQV